MQCLSTSVSPSSVPWSYNNNNRTNNNNNNNNTNNNNPIYKAPMALASEALETEQDRHTVNIEYC